MGGMDTEMLKKREKFRATIRNVPNGTMESLLLRQLKRTHAKNVHIRRNSNGNQGNAVLVDFATLRDKENATKCMIFYQNTRLRWDALSYIENKKYGAFLKKETEDRREINRRKRNLSESTEISRINRTSREEQRVNNNNYNIKKRKSKTIGC